MRLEWDKVKQRANLRKHSLDFVDAGMVFDGYTLTLEDLRDDYHERRFLTFGLLQGRVVAVAHTERADRIRIISMRKASKHEERAFYREIKD